jgi:putative molybdopterin biosynthesis protein
MRVEYSVLMSELRTSLKEARTFAGYTQSALATAIGISRQAYASIEGGNSIPATNVAMRLASELRTSVESIFHLPLSAHLPKADLVHDIEKSKDPIPLSVNKVGDRLIAWPLKGSPSRTIRKSLIPTNGLGERSGSSMTVSVELLQPLDPRSLVLIGCDPSTPLLVEHINQWRHFNVAWHEESSYSALLHLAHGHAHIAGCHLFDNSTGVYNTSWVNHMLPFPATVIHFALWEQGLIVASGNPKQVSCIDDIARSNITIINRELGSGSRDLLDRSLSKQGIAPQEIRGYGQETHGHLSVAELVGMGIVDVGIGVRSAAIATGLDFVPLETEQYDLVVPNHFLKFDSVQALLDAMVQADFRRRIDTLGGYDLSNIGVSA